MKNRGMKELEHEHYVVALKKEMKTKELSRVKAKCRKFDEKILFVLLYLICSIPVISLQVISLDTQNLMTGKAKTKEPREG